MSSGTTDASHEQEAVVGDGIAEQLTALARDLQQESGIEQVLNEIVRTAIRLIPHASEASISVVKARKSVESRAASGDLPRDVDAVQSETGQGPCLDAAFREQIVRVPNISEEDRWPRFAERAWDLGARSMLSFQLFVAGDNLGALNVYGETVGAFDEDDEEIGLLLAAHAAVAFADSQEISQLNAALVNRDIIGQAKGILMERYKVSAQQAFTMISAASANTNTKLIDVAEHLTQAGELTTGRTPRTTSRTEGR